MVKRRWWAKSGWRGRDWFEGKISVCANGSKSCSRLGPFWRISTAAQKRSPRIAACAVLIEPSAQVCCWKEGITSHRIAWRIANTFRFLSAVSLSDEKTEHKMEFFRAALFACRVTNQTVPYRVWTLGTSQKNISWQYYTQLTWHWFNTNENNNSQSKGLGPIEANLSGAHTPKHTTLVHILDLTVIHGSTSMTYRFCNRLKLHSCYQIKSNSQRSSVITLSYLPIYDLNAMVY